MNFILTWSDLDGALGITDIDIRIAVAKTYPDAKPDEVNNLIQTVSTVIEAIPFQKGLAVKKAKRFVVGQDYTIDQIMKGLDHPGLDLSEFDDDSPVQFGATSVVVRYDLERDPAISFLLTGWGSEPTYTCSFVDEDLDEFLKRRGVQLPDVWLPEFEMESDYGG